MIWNELNSTQSHDERGLEMANARTTAIVTGASQGIGAGLAEAFLKQGYSAAATSRNIIKTNPLPVMSENSIEHSNFPFSDSTGAP